MPPSSSQAILLVDGYNVIGAWTGLQQRRDRDGMAAARRELIEALVGYSAFQGYSTKIVFDAQYQGTPASQEVITKSLLVCYTDFKQTADTYIERACALFRQDLRKYEQRLIVATSDRAQQLTVVGYGAEWMSVQQLQQEVEVAGQRVRHRQKPKQRSSTRFLANALDADAQEKLAQLRLGRRSPEL